MENRIEGKRKEGTERRSNIHGIGVSEGREWVRSNIRIFAENIP